MKSLAAFRPEIPASSKLAPNIPPKELFEDWSLNIGYAMVTAGFRALVPASGHLFCQTQETRSKRPN